ncbi:protein of unknown function [Streptomyces sp. KY75]|nr:protein of unknown function [Streptomyces sp. KY70]CAD5974826.1 protein of unknown function [Streptomyces sp. KY75]
MADARDSGRPGGGGRTRRLHHLSGPGPGPPRPGAARLGQQGGVGAGGVRTGPGPPGPPRRGGLGRRPRGLRDGDGGAGGGRAGGVRGDSRTGPARGHRGERRRSPRGRTAGPRLRHDLPLGPPQAVGGHRGEAPRRGLRRPGPRPLQPGLQVPYMAGRQGARPAPGAPLPGHPGRPGPGRGRPDGERTYGAAGGRRPGGGGHADAADRGLVADALGTAGRVGQVHRVDAAPLPGGVELPYDPLPGLVGRGGHRHPFGNRWPPHHDDGNLGLAGGGELGGGGVAAAVLGDEHIDPVPPDDLPLTVKAERPPIKQDVHIPRTGRLRRIDGPHEKPQRIETFTGKGGEPHPPGGEEDPLTEYGQQLGCLGERPGGVPAVAVLGDPAGPAEGEERNMGLGGGQDRVAAHGGGEGVGGIDKSVDAVLTYPLRKPLGAPEPSDAHVTGRQPGSGHAPGERGGDAHARFTDQALDEPTGLGGPPENKDVLHVHHAERTLLMYDAHDR